MDGLDEKILMILREDARESYVSIASKLGTSEGTIRARTKRLLEEGVITRFTLKIASKNVKALVDVKARSNVNTANISEAIMQHSGVETVYEVSGESDLVVVVNVMSTTELNDIIERIRSLTDVVSTQTRLVLREH